MPISKFDHIGIVVADLDRALDHFRTLFDVDDRRLIYERDYSDVNRDTGEVDVMHYCLFPVGQVWFELIEPASDGPMRTFLERTGGGVHHVAITANDIKEEWSKQSSMREDLGVVGEKPRIDHYGVSYWFLHPKKNHGVLFEVDCEWAKTSVSDMTPVDPSPDWEAELATAAEGASL